ncbi:MAG: fibronectin type III domain-containing protein [Candidatus Thorarchaeota archaeon]
MQWLKRTIVLTGLLTFLLLPVLPLDLGVQQAEAVFLISEEPDFLRGPTVNKVTNNSALIFWRTLTATNASVYYGLSDSNLNMSESNTTLDSDHRITIDGLSMDTKYYYRVESDSIMSEIYHFKTAPADGGYFKMIIIGDSRPGSATAPVQPEVYGQLIDRIIAEEPHIIVMTGDYVYEVTTDHNHNLLAWEHFTNITDLMGHYAPVYGVIGNHDTGARTGSVLKEYFLDAFEQYDEPSTYSSFDYAGVHFTLLDSETYGRTGEIIDDQYDWLVNDLSTTTMPMKFVFLHRPFFPLAHIGSAMDEFPEHRDSLHELFESHNVTLVGAGHDHLYNQLTVNGIVHIIAGGGGAQIYTSLWGGAYHHYVRADVQSNGINFTAIKDDGSIGDEYQYPESGPIEIQVRTHANGTTKHPGTMPEIYFSRVPVTKYFSWDGETNSSTLTGVPDALGEHTLDVYAEDDEGVWGHTRFVYNSTGVVTTTTPEPTPTDNTQLIIILGVGVAALVVVIVLIRFKQR